MTPVHAALERSIRIATAKVTKTTSNIKESPVHPLARETLFMQTALYADSIQNKRSIILLVAPQHEAI